MIKKEQWKCIILDAESNAGNLNGLSVGDIDGDGNLEVVTGGNGALSWYRPADFEKGIIGRGNEYTVGLIIADIDKDGIGEVINSEKEVGSNQWTLTCYKQIKKGQWRKSFIDVSCTGLAHDVVCADIDGDGNDEIIVNAVFGYRHGIFIYKKNDHEGTSWSKYTVYEDIVAEGLSVGDLDGDGRLEIINGPDWYKMPSGGCCSGKWVRHTYAPNFRELCKTAVFDITGNGRPDIVITDTEFMDGYLSWFENRMKENPEEPWIEHRIAADLVYSHTLDVKYNPKTEKIDILTAEMEQGGWRAPYNHNARVIRFSTGDGGNTWEETLIYKGEGTHQGQYVDIDNDGEYEIIGKSYCNVYHNPKIQMWKKIDENSRSITASHSFIDRSKPGTAIDMVISDVNRDGFMDVVCGRWWYKNPGWERFEIPGILQVFNSYDIDGDGIEEVFAVKRPAANPYALKPPQITGMMAELSSVFCYLKPVDAERGIWEEYPIGVGHGDWPHGSLIAPVLPGGRLALIIAYHNSVEGVYPEIFEIPDRPERDPWKRRVLAEIKYGEVMYAHDITGNGLLDIFAGAWWLENMGDGSFTPHTLCEGFDAARIALMDVNNDGKTDVIMAEHTMDSVNKVMPYTRIAWFECPEDPVNGKWTMHPIDAMRCVHSLETYDIDGDGELELVCAEHDPYWKFRSRCKLLVYKKEDAKGRAWRSQVLDSRFEHHNGTKVFEIKPGKVGIASHAWSESIYVHLWEIQNTVFR